MEGMRDDADDYIYNSYGTDKVTPSTRETVQTGGDGCCSGIDVSPATSKSITRSARGIGCDTGKRSGGEDGSEPGVAVLRGPGRHAVRGVEVTPLQLNRRVWVFEAGAEDGS